MHTTASSLVAIAQYFFLYGSQQKFIEAVNDYSRIRFEIRFEFKSYPSIRFEIRFERKFPIRSLLFCLFVASCTNGT